MKTVVISLGGSIIVPKGINVQFLKKFRDLIRDFSKKGHRFAVYCGGGSLARAYQNACKKIAKLDKSQIDWIGIHATRLNAHMLNIVMGSLTDDAIITDPTKKVKTRKSVIAAGWKPGWSTDYDSVLLASNLKASVVINITNVDYVYDKDPKKFRDAKPINSITWREFLKIIGRKWEPGLHAPFDPVAAKAAEKLGIKAIITGSSIENIANILNNKKFKGTVIR